MAFSYADVRAYCSHVKMYCKRVRLLSSHPRLFIHSFILTLLWCLEVVISSSKPFPNDFEGGSSFSGLGYVENEDPGQFH